MARPIDEKTIQLMSKHFIAPHELTQAEVVRQLNMKCHSQFYLKFYRAMMQSALRQK